MNAGMWALSPFTLKPWIYCEGLQSLLFGCTRDLYQAECKCWRNGSEDPRHFSGIVADASDSLIITAFLGGQVKCPTKRPGEGLNWEVATATRTAGVKIKGLGYRGYGFGCSVFVCTLHIPPSRILLFPCFLSFFLSLSALSFPIAWLHCLSVFLSKPPPPPFSHDPIALSVVQTPPGLLDCLWLSLSSSSSLSSILSRDEHQYCTDTGVICWANIMLRYCFSIGRISSILNSDTKSHV